MPLPQDCLLCAAPCHDTFCPDCAGELPKLPPSRCPVCALPTSQGETCGRCLAGPPGFDATLAAFRYAFPVDKLIHAFKYGHRLIAGTYFGRTLAGLTNGLCPDLLLPMPLHPERLRQRGFNQAVEIARPVATALDMPISTDVCIRTRDTPPQADLELKERRKNLRNAFHCTQDLGGRRVLLVDDVMTTGTSADECARILKLHGAAHVTVMVVARALPR